MAGNVFIADMHDRDRVRTRLLVQQKQVPLNKNGKPYLALQLMDRSGTMEGRVWDNVERLADSFESGDFVELEGTVVSYQNRLQLKIDRLRRLDPADLDPEDFLPCSPRDRGQMLEELEQLLGQVRDPHLAELVRRRLADSEFRLQLSRAPAAKSIHHAYLGGLLEHTLEVMKLCLLVCRQYPELDRDLLLVGAFLHDVGKIHELGSTVGFEYTDRGRLVGHLVLGVQLLQDWVDEIADFPAAKRLLLEHLILSHHGSYEFGSPKRPKTREALVLNYLDELDAKLQAFRQVAQREGERRWSSFQRLFDRYLLLGPLSDTAADEPESAVEPAPAGHLRHQALAGPLQGLIDGQQQRRREQRQLPLARPPADKKD